MRRHTKRLQSANSLAQSLFTVGLVVVFMMIAGLAGLFVFDQVYQFVAADNVLPRFDGAPSAGVDEEWSLLAGDLPDWTGTERVNVLVMGIDQREYEEGPWRTDTMMVLTIDPVTKSGGMLSIPRDLWVPIPGYEEGRINTAHYLAEVYDYPGGGPALAAKTVQYNLGVPIHYYVRVNFMAFEEVVDMIGGIDVYVEEEIKDDTYPEKDGPGYDPLYIPAGWQHFDGEMALKYARTRHTGGGDFDRAKRQQQVVMAIFNKVTQVDMIDDLARQAPQLWPVVKDSVVTDLSPEQIVALARLAKEVDEEDIRYGVIDEHYTQFWETPDGQQVLIPLRDQIRELRDHIFTNEVPLAEEGDDPAARLAAEGATIMVQNGTTIAGLAGSTRDYLQQQGFQIANVGNADRSDYTESLILVHTGKVYTADYLARVLGFSPTAVVHGNNANAAYDVVVILGADYQPPDATPQP